MFLSCARLIQSMLSHPISVSSVLILLYLCLGLPSDLFPQLYHQHQYASVLSCIPDICLAPLILLDLVTWQVQTMKLLIVHFSPVPCSFLPLRLTYLPQFNCTNSSEIFVVPLCRHMYTPVYTPKTPKCYRYSSCTYMWRHSYFVYMPLVWI